LILHFLVEEGGFDAGIAAEAPLGGDHLIDEVGLDGVGGLEAEEVAFAEEVESGRVLVVEEEVFVGAEAVGGTVAGGDGLAGGGDGTGGLVAVAAGGRELFLGAFAFGLVFRFTRFAFHSARSIWGGRAVRRTCVPVNN
jgi:hypothetical protein